jgi:hypothetical protein
MSRSQLSNAQVVEQPAQTPKTRCDARHVESFQPDLAAAEFRDIFVSCGVTKRLYKKDRRLAVFLLERFSDR